MGDVQAFAEKYHPDTVAANRAINLFDDNVMSHFRKILQRRQKQQTISVFTERKKKRNSRERFA